VAECNKFVFLDVLPVPGDDSDALDRIAKRGLEEVSSEARTEAPRRMGQMIVEAMDLRPLDPPNLLCLASNNVSLVSVCFPSARIAGSTDFRNALLLDFLHLAQHICRSTRCWSSLAMVRVASGNLRGT